MATDIDDDKFTGKPTVRTLPFPHHGRPYALFLSFLAGCAAAVPIGIVTLAFNILLAFKDGASLGGYGGAASADYHRGPISTALSIMSFAFAAAAIVITTVVTYQYLRRLRR
jgi:hypothetical protein